MNQIDKLAAANFLDEFADETHSAYAVKTKFAASAPAFPQTSEGQTQARRYDSMRELAQKLRAVA